MACILNLFEISRNIYVLVNIIENDFLQFKIKNSNSKVQNALLRYNDFFYSLKKTELIKLYPLEDVEEKLIVCGLENQIGNKFQYYGTKRVFEANS